MNRKIDVDPFRGYPPPSNPSWIRFAIWFGIAVLLGWLVVLSVVE